MHTLILTLLLACGAKDAAPPASPAAEPSAPAVSPKAPAAVPEAGPGQAVAVFAGGCFWCMESDFDKLDGVLHTTSGYAGGHTSAPTYEDVNTETTGHKEAVRVVYDTSKLSYEAVLDWYWRHVDPTDDGGQFCDRGDSYRTAVFAQDAEQERLALASKAAIEARGVLTAPIVTPIVTGATFWPAENYHQDFHETNPSRYGSYRLGCGRDLKVARVWSGAQSQ